MTLAFRLYGNFRWPPSPLDVAQGSRAGVIDVFYLPDGDVRRAAVRWSPGEVIPGLFLPDKTIPQTVKPEDAVAFLEDGKVAKVFWIDAEAASDWLAFRGAFLIEQYPDAGPRLRLPLVNNIDYAAPESVKVFSGLRVLKGKQLELRINLPLPVEQSKASSTRSFPMAARYNTSSKVVPLSIQAFYGGWQAETTSSGTRIELKKHDAINVFRLGAFGMSERGNKPDNFLSYRDHTASIGQYWPENASRFAEDLLGQYGFEVGKDSWLRYGESGPADLSLRFESSDELITSLTYRIRVIRNGNQNPGDGSDLALEGDIFKLRLSDELGGEATTDDKVYYVVKKVDGWLRIGNDISADCQVSWQISDDVIWSNDPGRDWCPSVALRMHWAETIKDITGTSVDATTLFGGGLLKQANFAFRAAQVAMATGEAGQPHSFLPTLSYKDPNKSFRFALYSSPLRAVVDDDGILSWGRPKNTDGSFSGPWKRSPMRLSFASATELIKDTDEANDMLALTVTAGGMSFFNEAAASFNLEFSHDAGWPPASSDDIEDSEPFFASFAALVTATPAKEWRGRLASLEFRGTGALNNPTNQDELRGHLRIGGKGARDGLAAGGPAIFYQRGRVATEFRIVIPVSAIEPITVDVARFDRSGRATPLLIPVNERGGTSTSQGRYWLRATETLPMRQDRRLRADIIENSDEAGPRSFVVLSSEPFSVFRFTQQPFSSRGSADNASVAVYSGDDRIWQYRKASPYYHYILPPQSIGESADKPRRLEIHDLPASEEKEAAPSEPVDNDPFKFTENPPRPFRAAFKGDGTLDETLSNMQRRAVEQRLTPSAEIWIAPSDVERGYFMPEASSYDIFRQAGAFGLGAALAFLRAEFLYGLPVGIDVSKEGGIARGARVAEIEALVGRLAGGALETDADRDLAGRWDALRAAVARRPERLEIWARDLGSTVDFAPARFSDGVRFALRRTALHRPPLLDQTNNEPANSENPWTWPKVGVTTPEYKSAEDTNAPAKPRHHPQGLSGGALWPVESLNLFNVMLEQADSSGGTIEQIALSPMGGDAVQKAEFLGGQVAIISETRNGRVQRQQVEVIGRICALWHRAKHVVVYERTVNPSAQFAPKFDDDPDRTRSRRPILRKVREYIELLQPERGYPDFDTATQRSAGFLERVRFNASIINVDSAWSSEVADFGWQIPLWNRQAARERPQVYPMPDVAFVSTAEGDGEKPTVAQDCRDTDMLFFFADFRAGTSDTDRWKPYLGLDYVNLPHAKAMADVVDAKSIENPGVGSGYESEGRRRAVSRFLPGVRRFTWRLAPAAQKTALNAGRAGKPVYVGLDSVSFMRAGHRDDTHKAFPQGSPLEAALKIDATGASKPELTDLKYWSADGEGATIEGADTMSAHIGMLVKTLTDTPKDTATIDKVMGELATLWTGGLKDKLAGMTGGNLTNLKTVASGITSGALCQKLKDDAVGVIKRKEMLVTSALRDWLTEIDGALESGQAVLDTTKAEIIDDLAALAKAYVRPLFEEASQDIAQIGEAVEKARAIVVDVEVEIDLVIARARQRVDQFNAGYDKNKPWSPDRRKAFREGVEACIASVVNDIEAAIDEAAQRLATELNNASQSLAGHVAKLLKQVAAAEAGALGELTKVGAAVDRLLDRTDAALQELQSKASDIQGKIPELIAKVESDAELGKNPELQKAVLGLLTAAKKAVKGGHAQIDKARDLAQTIDDLVDSSVGGIEAVIRELATELTNLGNATVASIDGYAELATQLSAAGFEALKGELEDVAAAIMEDVDVVINEVDARLAGIGNEVDAVVVPATYWLDTTLAKANAALKEIPARILPIADDIAGALNTVKEKLGPDNLFEKIVAELIKAALEAVLEPIPDTIDPRVREEVLLVRKRLQFLVEELVHRLRAVSGNAVDALGGVTAACDAVNQGVSEVEAYFKALAADAKTYLEGQFGPAFDALKKTYDTYGGDARKLLDAVKSFDRTVRGLHNDLGRLQETAEAYAGRVLDAAGKLDDGGLLAVPNNVLKLYSAVTSAPELAALKADIDRIRSAFDELSDVIETTKANALFDRLSDELKAIGLSLPFDKIGDNLIPTNLSDLNIGAVFRNFGGTKLDKLFKGYRIPEGVRDAVKVTHDFDKKQARAWVQVDINAPFPGRRSLFSLGVFKADFIDMQLTGRVRLEASKDQQKVSVTGFGRIGTTIDAVVAGQSMVRFEKFGLAFTKEKGLDVEFDPKNVRLNPQFKFIQDFLASMYPELPGGLEWIRDNGMPVGVEHNFAIPNLSLTFGTSGVSNISLENHFRLIAFPDFLLANRFNLSTVERPFIFSIFIIGGTGYIQIEAEYKPVRDELTVLVEAAAGGSAQLAFAFGPFTGQVFITLSGVLSYRKTIGKAGGGLSISVVLVIAGHVDVAGIVTIGITLMLRMTYRDNGQIDADGSLTVTIRISRFFKLTARAQVKYKLRGGKSETSVSTSTSAEVDPEVARKAAKLEETAKKVQGAMK